MEPLAIGLRVRKQVWVVQWRNLKVLTSQSDAEAELSRLSKVNADKVACTFTAPGVEGGND